MKNNNLESDKTTPQESSRPKRPKRTEEANESKKRSDESAEVESIPRPMYVLFLNEATPYSTLMAETMRDRGICVTDVPDLNAAVDEWNLGVHDLILVDHSISLDDRLTLLSISAARHRPIPVMMIFEPDASEAAMIASENGASACDFRDDDLEYLVRVATMLENQARKSNFSNTAWLPSDAEEGDGDVLDLAALAAEMRGPAPDIAPAYLTVLGGPDVGKSVRIDADLCMIGRDPSCHLRLEDKTISKFHASVQQLQGGISIIRDLGSSNGTYIQGKRVTQAYLKGGDQILLGINSLIKFQR